MNNQYELLLEQLRKKVADNLLPSELVNECISVAKTEAYNLEVESDMERSNRIVEKFNSERIINQ